MWSDVPCRYVLKVEESDTDVAFDVSMPYSTKFGTVTVKAVCL